MRTLFTILLLLLVSCSENINDPEITTEHESGSDHDATTEREAVTEKEITTDKMSISTKEYMPDFDYIGDFGISLNQADYIEFLQNDAIVLDSHDSFKTLFSSKEKTVESSLFNNANNVDFSEYSLLLFPIDVTSGKTVQNYELAVTEDAIELQFEIHTPAIKTNSFESYLFVYAIKKK